MKSNFLARKSRVFLVDDHPLVRDGLRTLINQESDLEVCGVAEEAARRLCSAWQQASRTSCSLIFRSKTPPAWNS